MTRHDHCGITAAMAHRLAHEVRSPLAVVLGSLQHCLGESAANEPANPVQRSLLELAARSCNRLERLATRLDYISELEANDDLERASAGHCAIGEAVHNATDRAKSMASRTRVDIDIRVPPGPSVPTRHASAVGIACEEFVHNAIQHAKSSVVVTGRWSNDELRVDIEDDGHGVDPQILARLFEPPQTSGSGLGLGLWIANKAMERIGSRAEHFTTPENKTVFSICIIPPNLSPHI